MGDHVLMVPAKMSGKIKNAFASCKPRGKGVKTFTVPLLLTMRHRMRHLSRLQQALHGNGCVRLCLTVSLQQATPG